MKRKSNLCWLLTCLGAASLAFYFGRLSVFTRSPQVGASAIASTVETARVPEPNSRLSVHATAVESARSPKIAATDWESRWRELVNRPGSRSREQIGRASCRERV